MKPSAPVLGWAALVGVLLAAPLVLDSSFAVSLLSQMGIASIACLSYNILLGQGGMLSFGHAIYTGMGSYLAMHALRAVNQDGLWLPVSLLPLVGGLAGLACAAVFGFVSTRRSGTTFAMVTLGLGELVFAAALMFPAAFGGESGVSGNRVTGPVFPGITFASARQVYYLVAVYVLVSAAAMVAFTATPLGRMLNAVRDNPERAEFVGYSAQRVRYAAFLVSGFFAGIAGGLATLHFEIVTPEVLGTARSGAYLLFTFLGGTQFFYGPIIGAVLMVLALVVLSEWTRAWLLYLGLVFLGMVMVAPGGIASVLAAHARLAAAGRLRALLPVYLALVSAALLALAGTAALVEMVYHRQLDAALGPGLRFLGLGLDTGTWSHWCAAAGLMFAGLGLLVPARRRFARAWGAAQRGLPPTGQAPERTE